MAFGNPNSSRPKAHAIDLVAFKALPTSVEPFNVAAVQARVARNSVTPIRWRHGTFQVSQDATPVQYDREKMAAVRTFVRMMDLQGWTLAGRIQILRSPYRAEDPDGKAQEGMREYVVRAPFRKMDFRPVRIDVSHLVQ